MIENLFYCLNATIPIFLTLMLGVLFRKVHLFDAAFVSRLNKLVFQAFVTLVSIFISLGLSFLLKTGEIQGEFIQASYRSSAAILGIAIIQNMYGESGMAPLMIIASVPLYNIMAVLVLTIFRPDRGSFDNAALVGTIKGILTNPIILGILAGLVWSLLRLPLPGILSSTIQNLGKTATPLGLMAMGGALSFRTAFSRPKAAIVCSAMKLMGFEILLLPLAIRAGFTDGTLVAIIIMLGSASTVSCYIMARNMGHDGSFTSGVVMITTLLSSFTLSFWLFLCRSLGVI